MRAQATTKRELAIELQEQHGLTMSAYEALYVLSRAEDRRLKRVELAERLVLTPSGVTRLLEGLEAGGYVERVACETDLRVSYAQLTDDGIEKLEQASCGHTGSIRTLFEQHFSEDEVEALAELLGKLPGALDEDRACHGEP
jgi:DNA-binding MarR family transcriptional regulator